MISFDIWINEIYCYLGLIEAVRMRQVFKMGLRLFDVYKVKYKVVIPRWARLGPSLDLNGAKDVTIEGNKGDVEALLLANLCQFWHKGPSIEAFRALNVTDKICYSTFKAALANCRIISISKKGSLFINISDFPFLEDLTVSGYSKITIKVVQPNERLKRLSLAVGVYNGYVTYKRTLKQEIGKCIGLEYISIRLLWRDEPEFFEQALLLPNLKGWILLNAIFVQRYIGRYQM
jgi:hypothetical protein